MRKREKRIVSAMFLQFGFNLNRALPDWESKERKKGSKGKKEKRSAPSEDLPYSFQPWPTLRQDGSGRKKKKGGGKKSEKKRKKKKKGGRKGKRGRELASLAFMAAGHIKGEGGKGAKEKKKKRRRSPLYSSLLFAPAEWPRLRPSFREGKEVRKGRGKKKKRRRDRWPRYHLFPRLAAKEGKEGGEKKKSSRKGKGKGKGEIHQLHIKIPPNFCCLIKVREWWRGEKKEDREKERKEKKKDRGAQAIFFHHDVAETQPSTRVKKGEGGEKAKKRKGGGEKEGADDAY